MALGRKGCRPTARPPPGTPGKATGMAWAGAYVGDGVSTTNLAARTLRDLIQGRDTELTGLPWVNHRSRPWEPEPLRWLGVNAALQAMGSADAAELRTGRHLVLLLDRRDPATARRIQHLNERLKLPGSPTPVWGVADDDPEAATAFLWSIAGLFIKIIDWNPLAIAGARSLIASVVILVFLKRPKFTFSFPQIAAAIANSCTMLLFITANKTTTAAKIATWRWRPARRRGW